MKTFHATTHTKTQAKRALQVLAATSMLLGGHSVAQAQNIGVQLNGAPINFSGAEPVNSGGSILVPMRGVFEAMQAQVRYLAPTQTIIAKRGTREVQLTLGQTTAYINGSPITLAQPARSINGATYVPLRFVADAFGARATWNGSTQTVVIDDPTLGGGVSAPTQPATPAGTAAVFDRVDLTPPPTVVLNVNNALRRYDLAPNVDVYQQVGNGTTFGPLVPIEASDLRQGDDVRIALNGQTVTQITAQRVVRAGRVVAANGNRITLDDGTQLIIGTRFGFINAQGQSATTATIAPNSPIALFVRAGTGAVYGASIAPNDVAALGNTSVVTNPNFPNNPVNPTNPTNPNLPINNNGPIQLVKHSATRALTTGGAISVEVRGTPGLRGTFDLSPRLANLPLQEAQAGLYRGNYIVKAGDDVLNAFVTARLVGNSAGNAIDATQQSAQPLTIDTVAPRLMTVTPANGSTTNDARPTIVVEVDDVGGSGLFAVQAQIIEAGNPTPINVTMTVVPPLRATAVVPRAISGNVEVRLNLIDNARNQRRESIRFNVTQRAGAIASVSHDATRPLRGNNTLTVDLQAQPGGRATFDLLDQNNRAVAQRVPMTEVNAGNGRYRGTYTFTNLPASDSLTVRARFDDLAGGIDTLDSTAPVLLATSAAAAAQEFSITSPLNDAAATGTVVVRGRGTPGALVEVSTTATGTRTLLGIFGYQAFKQVLDTKQVQVDTQGNWATPAFTLTTPRNIAQLQYVISATQTDVGNLKTAPETVTLNPAG